MAGIPPFGAPPGISLSITDGRYLKLDASNGPLTGNLGFGAFHPTAATVQTEVAFAAFTNGSGYATVAANSIINNLNNFAVIGWVQMQASSQSFGMIFTKGQGGGANDSAFLVFRNSTGFNLAYRWWDNSNTQHDMTGTKQVFDGAWHEVLMMYDGSTMYGYVDGVLDTSTPFSGTLQTTAAEFGIGEWNVGSPILQPIGAFQEVQLYNRALSGTEITNLYNSGAGVIGTATSGLVVGLHLGSGSGSTDSDYSGNGFDATLTSMSWVTGHVATTVSIPHVLNPWTSSDGSLPGQEGIINIGDPNGTLNFQGINLTSTFNGNVGITVNSLGQVGIGTLNPSGTLTLDGLGVQNPLVITNNGTVLLSISDTGALEVGTGQTFEILSNGTSVFSIPSGGTPHVFQLNCDTFGVQLPGNSALDGGFQQGIWTASFADYVPINDVVAQIGPKGAVNLDLKLNSGQTNNLWQVRDASGTVLANMDSSAGLHIPTFQLGTSSTSGYVLTTNSSGIGTWQAIPTFSTTLTGDVTGSGTSNFATTIKTNVGLAGSPTTTTQSAGDSSTKIATTAFVGTALAAPTASASVSLTAGTAYQNTSGTNVVISGVINITAAVGGSINLGMGATSTPTTQPISPALSTALLLPFTARVPNNYYLLIQTSGTITVGSITAIAT